MGEEKFELTITAQSVTSTDERFTMDDLSVGDNYKPLDAYFKKADGTVVKRAYGKNEKKISNQTLPRIACQVFEAQIASLTAQEKADFPVCRYWPEQEVTRGIYPSVAAYRKDRNTLEYLVYTCGDGKQFVIYSWNVFATLVFVWECLKRFGEPGDAFVLVYREKTEAEKNEKKKYVFDPDEWIPKAYDPGISAEKWAELLADSEVFTPDSLLIVKRLHAYGDQATCTQLAAEYGESKNFYNTGSSRLAQRVARKLGLGEVEIRPGVLRWWPILYQGQPAGKKDDGSFIWKLRKELAQALDQAAAAGDQAAPAGDQAQPAAAPPQPAAMGETYTRDNFLAEVYMPPERYDTLVEVLRRKKNIILQGAPGVGKTFAARRLAWSLMGAKDEGRIELVQFHQSYAYEDFIMGYKPAGGGFALQHGIFYRFCEKAASRPEQDFFFLIDEINRGNMSKIFGELLMLIEKEYRGIPATLAYNGRTFAVPENVYIIGMMNTADRSLAMIDYALRRRFSFFEMEPGFLTDGFAQYQASLHSETLDRLIEKIVELNRKIARDKALGRGFCIGHSYFCGQQTCTDAWLRAVVDYDILPMLSEYWFDDPALVQEWADKLHGVFQ